jgi:hypothetical protein
MMTTGDVAKVLRCCPRTVELLALAGDLLGEETWGGQWIFRRREVEAFQARTGGRLVPTRPRLWRQLRLRFPSPHRAQPLPWGPFRMLRASLQSRKARRVG